MQTYVKSLRLIVLMASISLWLSFFVLPQLSWAGTALGDLAAQMQAGEWRELTTNNMIPSLDNLDGPAGVLTIYTDDMVWDSAGGQAFLIGADHLASQGPQFVSYTASSNTWQRLARPSWLSGQTFFHGYDHSALNQTDRILYHRPYSQNLVHRYDIRSQTWTVLPTPAFPNNYANCCDALEYFPELNGLVWVRGNPGEVWLFKEGTQQWSRLGTVQAGGTWQQAEYNPVHAVMVFTVGGLFYKLSSAGQVTPLATPPVSLYNGSGYNGVLTVDPVSGDYLALTPTNRSLYRYNVLNDSWQAQSSLTKPNLSQQGVVATPVSTYGITLFAACTKNNCRAYLYKHVAGSGTPPPPTDTIPPSVSISSPTNGATISGTTTISATASDNGGVTGVQFRVNGVNLGIEDTVAPYSASWDTKTVANGVHTLTAVARDTSGTATTSTVVRVTVSNAIDNIAPAVPTNLAAAAISSSQINLNWAVSTDNVAVTGYKVYRGGSLVGTVTSTNFANTGLTAQTAYSYTVQAFDAAGNSSVQSAAVSATTLSTPPPGSTTDFTARCSAPSVIKCVGFDNAADIAGTWGNVRGIFTGNVAPSLDTAVKASGSSALKFTIPSNSGAGASGSYFTNFSNDLSVQFGENQEFYVQWRQRFSSEMLTTLYTNSNGFKQAIITTGDKPGCVTIGGAANRCANSCEAIGLILENTNQRRFPILYNSCTGSTSHGPYDPLYESFNGPKGADFKLQNARLAPYCLYSQGQTTPPTYFPPTGNCFGYFANEWMTFQIRMKIGPRVNDEFVNSYITLWAAREGRPAELVFNYGPYNLTAGPPGENQRYGKVWLLPYQTNKDSAQSHPTAYTWYDELIISRNHIADPGAEGTTPPPLSAPTNLAIVGN